MTDRTYSTPNTTSEAQELLRALELPTLDSNTIRAIGAKEGVEFKQALADAANNEENAEARRKYIKTILTACAPLTSKTIRTLGFLEPEFGSLIDLSKHEGAPFGAAIRTVGSDRADQASIGAARTYLTRVLRTICQPAPLSTATPATEDLPSARPQTSAGSRNPAVTPKQPQTTNNVARLPTRSISVPADTPAASGEAEGNGRRFLSFHLYGGKAAMCFSLNVTRRGSFPTVQIEAATAKGEKVYDWDKKVSFQLTVAELPLVFGVLFGFSERIELTGHGPTNDKSLTIEDQRSKFFMSMRVRGGGTFAIPVLPKDTYAIMAMIFGQMKANNPELSDNQLMLLAKRVCEKTAAATQAQPRASNA